MATFTSPLTRLAEQLLENAKALDAYNQTQGLPPASFDEESFRDPPLNIENRRQTVISLAQDLKRQAQGPRDLVSDVLNSFTDLASLHFLYRYDIAYHVPLDGEISYAKLADAAGVDEVLLRRMLHMAMMNRIFIETRDGDVRHSAVSKILHQEPGAMDACGFMLEEMFPASTKMVEAIDRHPGSGEPNEAAFNVAFKTELPFCKALESAPERARRFDAAMRWMSRGSRFSHNHLIRGYDWAALDQAGGCVVDVGGGHGAVSVALAQATRQLHFVVQDLPGTARHGEKQLPSSLKGRVEFMAHDFFAEQPVRGADVYLFRYILHNWSDKYARKILKAIVPAMRDGSRILCIEVLPSNASSTAWSDKQAYNMDMISAMSSNSIERKSDDWQNLFSAVDSRLQYLGARTPPGCAVSLIEARFSQTT